MTTKKNLHRVLSLFMAFVLTLGLSVTALAVDGNGYQVFINDAYGARTMTTAVETLHTYGGRTVASVTVANSADTETATYCETYTDFDRDITATTQPTYGVGTTYQIYKNTTDGVTKLYFQYVTALTEDLYVTVETDTAKCVVNVDSGVYGENNNQGGGYTCIASQDSAVALDSDDPYTVTFTPRSGLEIVKLNLRQNGYDGYTQLVDATTATVRLGQQTLDIITGPNGTVTVSAATIIRDLSIVALTKSAEVKYDLNTITDGNCSADVKNTTLPAGTAKTVTFTPSTGYIVTDITIYDGAVSKVVSLDANNVVINDRKYVVERKLDGSAVVSIPAMGSNVTVSAVASKDVHYIQVTGAKNIYTNKTGVNYVNTGDSFEFVYAPDSDTTEIRSITISTPTIGTRTYYVDGTWTSDELSGVYYDATTGLWYNGSYWETIGENWILGSDGRYYNTVTGKWYDTPYGNNIDWTAIDSNWVRDANGNYIYRGTAGVYNGAAWTINGATISIYYDSRNYMHILVKNVSENMAFAVNGYDSVHTVSVSGDNGVDFPHSTYDVDDGDDLELEFAPAKDSYSIKNLYITIGANTYKAVVEDDAYVRVNGVRWTINVDEDGVVLLTMVDITDNVSVRAETNYTALRNMRITKSADSHSAISYTGTAPFDSEDKVTVRVYTDSDKYILDKVTFKLGTKSGSVSPFDKTLSLDGIDYDVKWVDNTEFSIEFDPLPGSITVTSKSVKGEVKEVPEEEPEPSDEPTDEPIDVPTAPVIPVTPTTETHNAYMKGYGDGNFGPDRTLTRAEAVTLLNRAILGMDDSSTVSYASSGYFTDVPSSFWGAGAINYAGAQGYLSVLSTSSNFNPNTPITRAEFLALLCKYRSVDVSSAGTTSMYSDVPASHWAIKYINYATSQGWVQGTGSSQFNPDSAVTRAAICTMVNHILGRTADSTQMAAVGATFADVPLSYWGYADIFEATHTHQATVSNGVETWM